MIRWRRRGSHWTKSVVVSSFATSPCLAATSDVISIAYGRLRRLRRWNRSAGGTRVGDEGCGGLVDNGGRTPRDRRRRQFSDCGGGRLGPTRARVGAGGVDGGARRRCSRQGAAADDRCLQWLAVVTPECLSTNLRRFRGGAVFGGYGGVDDRGCWWFASSSGSSLFRCYHGGSEGFLQTLP